MSRPSVLFLCTGNSCRSQMAEGWAKHHFGDRLDVYSAGIEAHGLNPNAVAVMAEAGVDISTQESQLITAFTDVQIDTVITVCGHAHENCPVFPGSAEVIHHGFDDPPKMAAEAADEEAAMNCYRQVRDQVAAYIQTLPEVLKL